MNILLLFSKPGGWLVLTDLTASGVGCCALLAWQYVAVAKVPHVHKLLSQPGTGGPNGETLDPFYNMLKSMGMIGRNSVFGMYFFFLIFGRTYYRHRGKRHMVRLATHTVPSGLKRWILIPGCIGWTCALWLLARAVVYRLVM